MKKLKRITVLLICLLAIGGGGYYFYTQVIVEDKEDILWREYPVTKGNIMSYFDGTGKLNLIEETYTRDYWMMVSEVYVKEGQEVKKGQAILKDSNGNIIEADSDGVVVKLEAEAKKEIQYKKPIVTIGNYDKKYTKIMVSQEEINNVVLDQKVLLNFMAESENDIEGVVTEINQLPKDVSGAVGYEVTVKLAETDTKLLSGMTASAKFIKKNVENVLTVSNKGIEYKDGNQQVLIRDKDGEIKKVTIKTGFSDGAVSEVIEGLKEGDIVVVKG
ncbi:MAG: HlyD family efflux transporter periplasmic adaptor subunit [Vagococcus sp.]